MSDPITYPREWNVFPIVKNEKAPPLLKDWQQTKFPREKLKGHQGNYGIGTGMISGGLIVFDWDFRVGYNRKKKGMDVVYTEFRSKFPKYINTLIAETPHGFHFYYIFKNEQVESTNNKNACYTKKEFISQNKTRFGKYLAGMDTRANGGYVVCPPSVVKGKEYIWVKEKKPLEISLEEYNEILQFFKLPKSEIAQNTVRQGFVDVLKGDLNPNEMGVENEHVIWKEMFHECATVGLLPKDLLEGLNKFQKGFDLEKTKQQLNNQKNIDYILNGKRLSDKKYREYFKLKDKPIRTEKEEIEKLFEDEFDDAPDDCEVIEYDNSQIRVFNDRIQYLYVYRKKVHNEKILDCSFKMFRKCYHKKEERFSYELNGKYFYTDTILDILRRSEPYSRRGLRGKDCMKEVISHFGKQLKPTKPREFLGFDNGWILPHTEDEKNVSIVVITDYQQEAYARAKKLIGDYTEDQRKQLRWELKEFIRITQCEIINLLCLIGWSMAAPFRLFFIKEYDLFPILYNYGPPNTGRSTLEDFWIVDFYRIYDSHLPPNTSIPRLEDHLSKSTFPQSLQDLKETNMNREVTSMLQDYSTSIGLFERKKGSKEIEFIKYKIAGLNLDSNDILEMFSYPAINERQIFMQYAKKIELDLKWIELRKKLKKYKLFTFFYEYTKDWTDKEVEKLFNPILEEFNSTFNSNSSRLIKSASIVKFGITLFLKVFNLELRITNDEIMNAVIEGSTKMTEYIVDQFREFCILAINYDETTETIKEYADGSAYSQVNRGENPHYLNHKLRLSHNNRYYAYTSKNHEDYKKRYNERAGMKSFVEKLQKGLDAKESNLVQYVSARPFQENGVLCKPMGVIKIYPEFLNDSIKQLSAKDLTMEYE